jgi:hypothetical protein
MSATILAFKPAYDPIRDPRRHVLSDHYHSLLGMNQRQEGMAHHLSWEAGTHDDLTAAFIDYVRVTREFRKALEAYRAELLRALDFTCPAAAKRIREGKPPRRSRRKPLDRKPPPR